MLSNSNHLTHEESCQVYALRKNRLSGPAIARQLGRGRTTVWRKVRRSRGGRGYRHKQAYGKASARRSAASSVPTKMTPDLWRMVEGRLFGGWSPEQSAGRLKMRGVAIAGRRWIYHYVRADREAGGELYLCLGRHGKKPNRKGGRHVSRGHIPGRVEISERPAVAEAKERVGDRQADTIIGKSHSATVTSLAERVSKYALLERVGRKTARRSGAPC